MPAKLVDGQPVGPATPRKRTPKPPSEPSAPRETTLESVQDEVGELRASIEVMNEDGVLRPGIVHRLDKDTSGLLVVAKTLSAQARLAAQIL